MCQCVRATTKTVALCAHCAAILQLAASCTARVLIRVLGLTLSSNVVEWGREVATISWQVLLRNGHALRMARCVVMSGNYLTSNNMRWHAKPRMPVRFRPTPRGPLVGFV